MAAVVRSAHRVALTPVAVAQTHTPVVVRLTPAVVLAPAVHTAAAVHAPVVRTAEAVIPAEVAPAEAVVTQEAQAAVAVEDPVAVLLADKRKGGPTTTFFILCMRAC